MIVFLDLEETLIDNWENGWLLPAKIAVIREMFTGVSPSIGLMSWAVWDDEDKAKFNSSFRPELEEALGMKFSDELVWSMHDWARSLLQYSGKHISREDLFDCFSKHEVLFMLSRCHPALKGEQVVLVDDAVEHCLNWHSHANDCRVLIQNIDELLKHA